MLYFESVCVVLLMHVPWGRRAQLLEGAWGPSFWLSQTPEFQVDAVNKADFAAYAYAESQMCARGGSKWYELLTLAQQLGHAAATTAKARWDQATANKAPRQGKSQVPAVPQASNQSAQAQAGDIDTAMDVAGTRVRVCW